MEYCTCISKAVGRDEVKAVEMLVDIVGGRFGDSKQACRQLKFQPLDNAIDAMFWKVSDEKVPYRPILQDEPGAKEERIVWCIAKEMLEEISQWSYSHFGILYFSFSFIGKY